MYNAGLLFGRCVRCGRATIRRPGGRSYAIPRGTKVRYGGSAEGSVSPRRALYLARKRAPFTHRLPRRQSAWASYYD